MKKDCIEAAEKFISLVKLRIPAEYSMLRDGIKIDTEVDKLLREPLHKRIWNYLKNKN